MLAGAAVVAGSIARSIAHWRLHGARSLRELHRGRRTAARAGLPAGAAWGDCASSLMACRREIHLPSMTPSLTALGRERGPVPGCYECTLGADAGAGSGGNCGPWQELAPFQRYQQPAASSLSASSATERNRAAAAALQLFFRLAEAEGGVHNSRRRAIEVNHMISDVERLQAAGLQPPVSLSTIRSRLSYCISRSI